MDLNTDQFPELLVSNNVRNSKKPNPAQQISSKLYGNEKGTLKEVPFDSGVLSARNIAVFDFDGDGLLDLFVVEDPFNQKAYRHGSVLLKNLGNMKFQNYNAAAGIPNEVYGLGMAVADLNEDGVADFFVTYSNRLFLSQSNHTYREVPELNQTFRWNATDTEDWPSGAAFGDLNLDGKLDLVIANHHAPAHNRIFLTQGVRNGIPSFLDVTKAAGIEAAVPVKSPHVEIQDFDNDGLPDIYTSAAYQDKNDVIPLIYRNIGFGNGTIPKFQASIDFKQPMIYFPAGPTADFDRDGKIDLFLVSWEPTSSSRLLRNVTSGGNWLEITAPVGTKLQLFSNRKLVGNQQLYPGFGFSSGQPPIAHFGLGKLDSVDIEAILPGGRSIKKTVRANRIIDVQK